MRSDSHGGSVSRNEMIMWLALDLLMCIVFVICILCLFWMWYNSDSNTVIESIFFGPTAILIGLLVCIVIIADAICGIFDFALLSVGNRYHKLKEEERHKRETEEQKNI